MHAIITYHDENYRPLADITWYQNKIPYCEKYGYHYEYEPLEGVNHVGQVQKVRFINRMLSNPNYDWIWWTGCDLMITNFNISIDNKIDSNYHMIIATDCNGINADSILIRNSDPSREYWKMIEELLPSCAWDWEGEQGIIKRTYQERSDLIKIVPQREINAYNYDIYQGRYPHTDAFGNDGDWQPGDWAIQWPGVTLPGRVELAKIYSNYVIK